MKGKMDGLGRPRMGCPFVRAAGQATMRAAPASCGMDAGSVFAARKSPALAGGGTGKDIATNGMPSAEEGTGMVEKDMLRKEDGKERIFFGSGEIRKGR